MVGKRREKNHRLSPAASLSCSNQNKKKKNQNNPISSSVTRQVSDVARHGPQADLSDTRHVILRPSILVFTEAKEEKEEEASGDATSAKER